MKSLFGFTLFILMLSLPLWAQEQAERSKFNVKKDSPKELTIIPSDVIKQSSSQNKNALNKEIKEPIYSIGEADEVNYTLGANDSIEIKIQSH